MRTPIYSARSAEQTHVEVATWQRSSWQRHPLLIKDFNGWQLVPYAKIQTFFQYNFILYVKLKPFEVDEDENVICFSKWKKKDLVSVHKTM
jgi:hypothetical protein